MSVEISKWYLFILYKNGDFMDKMCGFWREIGRGRTIESLWLIKHFEACKRAYILPHGMVVWTADRNFDVVSEDQAGRRVRSNVLGINNKAFMAADKCFRQTLYGFFHRGVGSVKLLGRMIDGTSSFYSYVNNITCQHPYRGALCFYPYGAFVFFYMVDLINSFP